MTSMRKVVGFLIALPLMAFALPAAATYYYSLNMCAYGTGCTSPIAMTAVNNVSTGTVTAIIKNESPLNLTTKSFTLSVPSGSGLTITDATLPAGQTATKSIQGGTLTVKNLSIGIVKGSTYAVTLTVQTTTCTAISGSWTAQPWTGSSLNGSKFVMYPASATHPATTFAPACTFAITTTVTPSGAGSLTCAPNPVPYNGSSSCTATAGAGYDFSMFSGACSGATPSCTVTGVKQAVGVTATFTPKNYPVTATVPGGHGSIAPTSPTVPYNTPAQLTVTPDAGYAVGTITSTCGGSLSGSGPTYTFTTGPVPVGGCTVTGSFTPISYTVTTAKTGSGTGTITPLAPASSSVPFGTTPTFTVAAAAGSSIDKVTDTCGLGGSLSGSTYTAGAVPVGGCTVTAAFITNTLTITSQPSSVALNAPFDVAIGINPGPATVGADTSACGGASVSTKASTATSAMLTFTIPPTATITTCAITFTATNYSSPPPTSLKVLAAQSTACSTGNPVDQPPPGSQFTASCATGGINVSGFAAGVRGPNKAGVCDLLNFTLTNNICGAVVQQDGNGNQIPPNAVSFVWDQTSQTAAFTYTVTWKSEYVDPGTGLPFPGRTKYCTGTGSTACDTTQTLKACLSPLVAFGSIPAGDPACSSEEGWAVVQAGDPGGDCSGLPNPNGTNPPPACVRVTTTIIDAKDPPITRG